MARKRMIDPSIWDSEDFSKLGTLARLVFIGMFSFADDYGYGRAKANYLRSVIFPYDEELKVADIDKALDEIAAHMSVIFYACDGNEYYSLTNWSKWQRVDKPSDSKIPPFCDDCTRIRFSFEDDSASATRTIPPNRKEEKRKEEKEEQENGSQESASVRAIPPERITPLPQSPKKRYGEFKNVSLSEEEYGKLVERGLDVDGYIDRLDGYIKQSTKNKAKYTDHYATILNWWRGDGKPARGTGTGKEQQRREQSFREIIAQRTAANDTR